MEGGGRRKAARARILSFVRPPSSPPFSAPSEEGEAGAKSAPRETDGRGRRRGENVSLPHPSPIPARVQSVFLVSQPAIKGEKRVCDKVNEVVAFRGRLFD